MKFKIICRENWQDVEAVVEVEDYLQLAETIHSVRDAIKLGTCDIGEKEESREPSNVVKKAMSPKAVKPATDKQKALIKRNSKKCNIEKIDLDALSQDEASAIIDAIFEKTE